MCEWSMKCQKDIKSFHKDKNSRTCVLWLVPLRKKSVSYFQLFYNQNLVFFSSMQTIEEAFYNGFKDAIRFLQINGELDWK